MGNLVQSVGMNTSGIYLLLYKEISKIVSIPEEVDFNIETEVILADGEGWNFIELSLDEKSLSINQIPSAAGILYEVKVEGFLAGETNFTAKEKAQLTNGIFNGIALDNDGAKRYLGNLEIPMRFSFPSFNTNANPSQSRKGTKVVFYGTFTHPPYFYQGNFSYAAGEVPSDPTGDFTTLYNMIIADRVRLTDIETKNTEQDTRLTDLESDVATNTSDITALETDVATNTSDITALETDVANINTDVTEINSFFNDNIKQCTITNTTFTAGRKVVVDYPFDEEPNLTLLCEGFPQRKWYLTFTSNAVTVFDFLGLTDFVEGGKYTIYIVKGYSEDLMIRLDSSLFSDIAIRDLDNKGVTLTQFVFSGPTASRFAIEITVRQGSGIVEYLSQEIGWFTKDTKAEFDNSISVINNTLLEKADLVEIKSLTGVVGNIYTEAFEATTIADNYTVTGAASFTRSVGKITVNGSNSWISLKNFISGSQKQGHLFRWKYKTDNTKGLGVGWQHPTISAQKLNLFLDCTTPTTSFINTENSGSIDLSNYIISTNKTMAVLVDDILRCSVALLDWSLRYTVYNERSGASLVLSYTFTTGNSGISPTMNFMGNPTIFANGGEHEFLTFSNDDYNLINPDYIALIDSIGKGYNLVNWQSSFLAKAQANGLNIIPFGAHGAFIADFTKTAIYNYLAKFSTNGVKPKIVIQVGSNTISTSGAATALTDLAALKTALEGLGYTVIICNVIDRVSQTAAINTYNAGVVSAYSATNTLIDYNSVLGVNTSLNFAFDGIHLTVQGSDNLAAVTVSTLLQGQVINTITTFNTQRTYDIIENLAPVPTTAGALIGTGDTTITVTGTTISTWPQYGYVEFFNTSTGLSEIFYYPRRDNSNFYGVLRAQFNTTAISTTGTISFGRFAFIDKIRGENIFGKKAMYFEFGAVTNSSNRAPAFVYGLAPQRYFLNAQYTWISESNTVFNFVQKGTTSDLGIYFSKGATGQSTSLVFGFLNGSGVLPSSTFNLKHTATNQMAFGPNTDPTLGVNINTLGYVGIKTTSITSQFHVTGSMALGYVAKTGTYTATVDDYLINCTSGTFTVTLPTAVGITGRVYEVVNSGAGTITVGTTSSQTFANVTATPTTLTIATALGKGVRVMSNGANWIVLNS